MEYLVKEKRKRYDCCLAARLGRIPVAATNDHFQFQIEPEIGSLLFVPRGPLK